MKSLLSKIKTTVKSWKTTLVGFILIAIGAYEVYFKKEITTLSSGLILAGVGLLVSKDHNVTHEKKKEDGQ